MNASASDTARPRVDVVVVADGEADFARGSVKSALLQTHPCGLCLVVDPHSESETALAEEYRGQPGVTIVESDGRGLAAARDAAITVSDAEHVLCLRAGDLALLTYVEKMLRLLEADEGLGFAYSAVMYLGDTCRYVVGADHDFDAAKYHDFIGPAALFRRDAWQAAGGFPDVADDVTDWAFWIAIGRAGRAGMRLEEPLLFSRRPVIRSHRWHIESSATVRRHHAEIYP